MVVVQIEGGKLRLDRELDGVRTVWTEPSRVFVHALAACRSPPIVH